MDITTILIIICVLIIIALGYYVYTLTLNIKKQTEEVGSLKDQLSKIELSLMRPNDDDIKSIFQDHKIGEISDFIPYKQSLEEIQESESESELLNEEESSA